jgi:hypothetical protein
VDLAEEGGSDFAPPDEQDRSDDFESGLAVVAAGEGLGDVQGEGGQSAEGEQGTRRTESVESDSVRDGVLNAGEESDYG